MEIIFWYIYVSLSFSGWGPIPMILNGEAVKELCMHYAVGYGVQSSSSGKKRGVQSSDHCS